MTDPAGSIVRNDRAVIMARGGSLRMGSPKGLLRFSAQGKTFVCMIADLYLQAGFPVDVICTAETAGAYRAEFSATENVRVLEGASGGDTAMTVLTVWRSLIDDGMAFSHLWVHPVDLPLVDSASICKLQLCSASDPSCIIRPRYRGAPGHPVVIPGSHIAELEKRAEFHAGPLREYLEFSGEVAGSPLHVDLEIDDEGTVKDFDRPEDFDSFQQPTKNRGMK